MLANQYKSTHHLIAHLRQQGQGEETKSPPSSSCRCCSSLCDQVVTPELSQSATLSHCVTISHTVTCHLQRPPPPPKVSPPLVCVNDSLEPLWFSMAIVIFKHGKSHFHIFSKIISCLPIDRPDLDFWTFHQSYRKMQRCSEMKVFWNGKHRIIQCNSPFLWLFSVTFPFGRNQVLCFFPLLDTSATQTTPSPSSLTSSILSTTLF